MPVISVFFGIIIRMYYRSTACRTSTPSTRGEQATFSFDGELLAGAIRSRTARRLVKEWALAHRVELDANWRRMLAGETLERIPPLE